MRTYSATKDFLNIDIEKHMNDGFANLTHYWHNHTNGVSHIYKSKAREYLNDSILGSEVAYKGTFFIPDTFDIPFPPTKEPKFKFIDLFAGIGGTRIAYQNVGGKSVFSSEWDKFSRKTYEANFGELPFGDITKIDAGSIPNHDVLLAGFPCQPFSIAGVSKKQSLGREHGFLDETQGTLFFDIARILEEKRPKAFMLENVKNLVSHDKEKTFTIIKGTLEKLNYTIHYKILDSKSFVPQHRERIVIVGFNNDVYSKEHKFEFPELPENRVKLKDILQSKVDEKYTLSDKLWNYLQDYAKKHKERGNGFGYGLANLNGITRTLSARYYKDGSEILIPQVGNPRRLTPRECARLQGFPDTFKITVSNNQAYKQFGNTVTVPLIQSVAEALTKAMFNE